MPKSVAPGFISAGVEGQIFSANVMPDPFDIRDLEYRPRLMPLPHRLDTRSILAPKVGVAQEGNSCTGHAVATLINAVLAQTPEFQGKARAGMRVSPYMLYRLGRRYDEFPDETDIGSSLRGVLKGWHNHGVVLEEHWATLNIDPEPDFDRDEQFIALSREFPLGAYYRVNPYSLDDMQSAINELYAIVASGLIHDGWENPVPTEHPVTGESFYLIQRNLNPRMIGGHAFALVGYNEVGFIVQNSWGTGWGDNGFAILAYEDWLESAYDAWVARPGVPQTPFASGRRQAVTGRRGSVVSLASTDDKRLSYHMLHLGNNGVLSTKDKFTTTPLDIERMMERMEEWHTQWENNGDDTRHIVLYAHGGLVNSANGRALAQQHLNWWLNNHVYPIYFIWQSGFLESVTHWLQDPFKWLLPAAAADIFSDAFDRAVELATRTFVPSAIWGEMKENAARASSPIENTNAIQWPPTNNQARQEMAKMPGASLFINRLARYMAQHDNVKIHLVGHSAGSIFLTELLPRLADVVVPGAAKAGIPVDSLTFLAAGLRVDRFRRQVLPHIGASRLVRRFATYHLTETNELDDTCTIEPFTFYNRSLLWLVSRGFERPQLEGSEEVPLLGIAQFLSEENDEGVSLREEIEKVQGTIIIAQDGVPANDTKLSQATTHVSFAGDPDTMNSVLLRIRRLNSTKNIVKYEALPSGMELRESVPAAKGVPQAVPATRELATATAPIMAAAAADMELVTTPPMPPCIPEVADAPLSGSPIVDVLQAQGWQVGTRNGKR